MIIVPLGVRRIVLILVTCIHLSLGTLQFGDWGGTCQIKHSSLACPLYHQSRLPCALRNLYTRWVRGTNRFLPLIPDSGLPFLPSPVPATHRCTVYMRLYGNQANSVLTIINEPWCDKPSTMWLSARPPARLLFVCCPLPVRRLIDSGRGIINMEPVPTTDRPPTCSLFPLSFSPFSAPRGRTTRLAFIRSACTDHVTPLPHTHTHTPLV